MFRLFDPGLGSLVGVVFVGASTTARDRLSDVVRRIGPQVDMVMLVTDGPMEALEPLGLPVVSDAAGGGAGPLSGIAAAMAFVAANVPRARGILTVPADAVTLPGDFVAKLTAGDAKKIAVGRRAGALQPLFAYWPTGALDHVRAAITRGEERVKAVIESLPHRAVDFDAAVDPFADGGATRPAGP